MSVLQSSRIGDVERWRVAVEGLRRQERQQVWTVLDGDKTLRGLGWSHSRLSGRSEPLPDRGPWQGARSDAYSE
jgi:hypothetical protein